ncbi:SSI family serine proteinase inhibitor [Streptomyces sp. DH24]|uniref:SSI family serine proteinase inhibitor n=1 Tax=Streptomyces sp. DH24 TaxID=3040123 RepID=UPI002441A234|nr:SSI family serine proteinase inhibitor [Streptomyces sp. DH24]MDG9720606.1 SSI family serine proteinase inhibitor [Streptomyces sp. DH24]
MSHVITSQAAGAHAAPGHALRPSGPSRPTLRRLALSVATSLAALGSLAAAPSAAYADAGTGVLMPPPVRDEDRVGDHLVVTVRGTGGDADGTYELRCHPPGGSHPDPARACAAVEKNTRWGQDTFAPVPAGAACTMQYGGPATARVTGTWAGRPVDATYDRSNGCQIQRWDRLVPLLPDVR